MDATLVLVDLVLLRPDVYRHLLVNLLPRRANAFALLSRVLGGVVLALALTKMYLVATTSAMPPVSSTPGLVPFRARRLLVAATHGGGSVLSDALLFVATAMAENTAFALGTAATLLMLGAATTRVRSGAAAAVGACALPPSLVASSIVYPVRMTLCGLPWVVIRWLGAGVGAFAFGNGGFLLPHDPDDDDVTEVAVPEKAPVPVARAVGRVGGSAEAAVALAGRAATLLPADVAAGREGAAPLCELVEGAGAAPSEPDGAPTPRASSQEDRLAPGHDATGAPCPVGDAGADRGGASPVAAGESPPHGACEQSDTEAAPEDTAASWALLALAVCVALTVSSWPRLYAAAGLVWDISAADLIVVSALTRASNAAAIAAVTNRGWAVSGLAVVGGFACEAMTSTLLYWMGLNDAIAHL